MAHEVHLTIHRMFATRNAAILADVAEAVQKLAKMTKMSQPVLIELLSLVRNPTKPGWFFLVTCSSF
jgi:hypothetical protein